ncbi:MAG: hypothetical protein QF805_31575, partial [Pirellulaceae bacterium]|nr:hypothetical protein [Pirellulaceae bacterium]
MHGLSECSAFDIPKRDVDRSDGASHNPRGRTKTSEVQQFFADRFDVHWIVADRLLGERIDRFLERFEHQQRDKSAVADAFDTIARSQLERDKIPRDLSRPLSNRVELACRTGEPR